MRRRLSSCKGNSISFGDRIIFLKSVLIGIPFYFFSFYKAPKQFIKKLISLQRNFLWGGNEENKKIAWVRSELLCKNIDEGGLNIKNLELFNLALLAKWKWRLLSDSDALWKRLLLSKYGEKVSFFECPWPNERAKGSRWWLDLAFLSTNGVATDWFENNIRKIVGNGDSTRFWSGKWLGNEPLCTRFNRLFCLANDKDTLIRDKGEWTENGWTWKWSWRRQLRDREIQALRNLQLEVNQVTLHENRPDHWIWNGGTNEMFSVRAAYNILQQPGLSLDREFMSVFWDSKAQFKMKAFAWLLLNNRIHSKINLIRRGVTEVNDRIFCGMCGDDEEDTKHLFFSCPFVYKVWMSLYDWWGVKLVLLNEPKEHFLHHGSLFAGTKRKETWISLWFFCIWVIWCARNKKEFEGQEAFPDKSAEIIKAKMWVWNKAISPGFSFSFNDWFCHPLLCIT